MRECPKFWGGASILYPSIQFNERGGRGQLSKVFRWIVEVKVKAKAKAKILFNEGVSKILGGASPPKFWTLPH